MSEETNSPERKIRPISVPQPVPVFNLVVYVRASQGQVHVRAANLPDLEESAASEPLALKRLIEVAKRRLARWHAAGEVIPWIASPRACAEDESERYLPLHL